MAEIDLKPCPFCGCQSVGTGQETECGGHGIFCENHYVTCPQCGVKVFGKGCYGISLEETAKAWNRRNLDG